MILTRKTFLTGAAAALLAQAVPLRGHATPPGLIPEAELRMIETRSGGRLGFAALDSQDGRFSSWRGEERFALSSTFKFLLAAAVLMRADTRQEQLERAVNVPAAGLVDWSPDTERHAGGSMTVWSLCKAAVTRSDNTAANLLLGTLDGPDGFTRLMREAGDRVTRLDRIEPALNEAAPGDPRDSTTPAAMLGAMNRFLLGDLLLPASRKRLTGLLLANTTGDKRIRAGLPAGWQAGDKTGTGGNGAVSDLAILYPPGRAPVLVAAYFQDSLRPRADLDVLHAELGRLTAAYVMV